MTSSARARSDGGTVRPIALAVFRLTTSSEEQKPDAVAIEMMVGLLIRSGDIRCALLAIGLQRLAEAQNVRYATSAGSKKASNQVTTIATLANGCCMFAP